MAALGSESSHDGGLATATSLDQSEPQRDAKPGTRSEAERPSMGTADVSEPVKRRRTDHDRSEVRHLPAARAGTGMVDLDTSRTGDHASRHPAIPGPSGQS